MQKEQIHVPPKRGMGKPPAGPPQTILTVLARCANEQRLAHMHAEKVGTTITLLRREYLIQDMFLDEVKRIVASCDLAELSSAHIRQQALYALKEGEFKDGGQDEAL